MKYEDFIKKTSLTELEVLALSHNTLVEDINFEIPSLPAPPFLMLDSINSIERNGSRGRIVAEKKIRIDEWFFQCHFRNDPVMPGCLGVDAIWQLLGLYCSLNGAKGSGRALGCDQVEFTGQIRPHNKVLRMEVDVRRYSFIESQQASMVLGTGTLFVDDSQIYKVSNARVGIFLGLRYPNYPMTHANQLQNILNKED
ncbi:bifunctional 3-hydroxydecanoyl-ACP dehydratase/trans-2-decenoyl-ACP isomerase [Leptospira sp. GIMC2001]|uniref:bifunctional 3-hydroxydecanoyl-ACP dehydratase/trans-2-decenoyl-ACP isomerase n=1 Tax=Leptospira sp. GIMC2001 TaxID=1513297 RepID=UPI00234A25C4|nr:bifunctional 3-hydroxydecanoyl-ACP dehydratase/trans-2-decenoyl-ACP isomerase [Leptospira sp. GIMC2001]WCL50179.1 bifunctional 3-hydroxydecanoyl-ACP dehydratase/trans-2-decenoyl-ACP isomerase [Leptospira sp. GIMC2001]